MAGRFTLTLVATLMLMTNAYAADQFVYPKAGQSAEQQQKDEYQCYEFGRKNSGFDPMKAPTTTSEKPADTTSTAKTTLGGAGLGAIVGAIADGSDGAGKGAVIGGVSGLLFGGVRSRDNNKKQKDWEAQQQADYAANRNNYDRAFAACMEGRDYTVR